MHEYNITITNLVSVALFRDFANFAVLASRGAARNFVREGPVTDVVRFQTLAILHKDHFDVTGQFLVCYNRI